MRALTLLLLFAAIAAVTRAHDCPGNLHHADDADVRTLADEGLAAFRTHISQYCRLMPVYVTEPAFFDASVEAVCTNKARTTAQFKVVFKSPCKQHEMDTVYMTVRTKYDDCPKAYDPKLAKWGWYTKVPGNMRPLQCPTGFRKATKADFPLLQAFLNEEFTQKSMPELKAKEGGNPRYYCRGGIQRMNYHYLNGCIQTWPKGVSKYVMSQGKVTYNCYKETAVRHLGLDGEGKFRTICQPKVSFD